MPVIRLSRCFPTLLVISLIAVGCMPAKTTPEPPRGGGQSNLYSDPQIATKKAPWCTGGNGSANNPLICIDPATLTANPASTSIWDVEDDGNGNPSNRPVRIVWVARTNATLGIKFEKKGCVTDLRCNGPVCTANVAPLAVDSQGNKIPRPKADCKYEANVNGEVVDPDFEVNPCCM